MARVVQWATGSMGRTALRRIIDHPGLTLSGVHVYSDAKAGRDAGEIAKRPPTGIVATSDLAATLATQADIVIHAPRITLPYDALVPDVEAVLRSGKNVISTAGFHWPDAQGAAYAAAKYFNLRKTSIYGGSNEIQRNIISKMILGL